MGPLTLPPSPAIDPKERNTMTGPETNETQIEYWNEKSGHKWVRHQETLDRQIGPHGAAMIQAAAIAPGESVLDVGCGCGGTTLEIAREVGSEGRVTGLDISGPMLARARERAAAEGLNHVEFLKGDAQVYDLPAGVYDAAVSRFGVMFFDDPVAAFANIRKALKPGGRLAFACWRPAQENPWVLLPMMEAAKHVEMPPPPSPEEPGPFAFGDRERVERILAEAGYASVAVEHLDITMRLGPSADLEESVDFMFEIGPMSRLVAELDEPTQTKLREAIRGVMQKFHGEQGVAMPSAAWVVTARNS